MFPRMCEYVLVLFGTRVHSNSSIAVNIYSKSFQNDNNILWFIHHWLNGLTPPLTSFKIACSHCHAIHNIRPNWWWWHVLSFSTNSSIRFFSFFFFRSLRMTVRDTCMSVCRLLARRASFYPYCMLLYISKVVCKVYS